MPSGLSFISERRKRRRVAIAAFVVIVLCLISLVRTQCGRTASMDETPFLALGEVVAEETIRALGNKGGVVILKMETGGTLEDTIELQLNSFGKTLKKKSQIAIVATEIFQPPPYVDSDSAVVTDAVTGEFFLQVVRRYPGASAIVSFAGAPLLTNQNLAALGENGPPIIVAGNVARSPQGALKRLFDANLVLFAVTPRTTPPPAGAPKTPREAFDRFYQIVTPDKAGELPASS